MKRSLTALILISCMLFAACAANGDITVSDGTAESISDSGTDVDDISQYLQPLDRQQTALRKLNAESTAVSSVDMKNSTESGRILYVEDTDTTFWTDNKYLYQKNGEDSIALVSGIIYSLSLHEGRLYFIRSENVAAQQPMRGEPFMLELETGRLVSLSDRLTSAIFAQPDRVILRCFEEYTDVDGRIRGRYVCYECSDGEEAAKCDDILLCTDGKSSVYCETDGGDLCKIYLVKEGEIGKRLIAEEEHLPRMASLYGGYLYYVEGSWGDTIKRIALDGSETAVCCTDYQYIWDYTFFGGELYLLTDAYFGPVDDEMRFIRGRITHEDISSTQFYSLYSYKGDIIATSRAGFRKVTPDEYGNYLFSHYSFKKDDIDATA